MPNSAVDLLHRLTRPGSSVRAVAHDLGISESAAKRRLGRLYAELGVNSQLQAWVLLKRRRRTRKRQGARGQLAFGWGEPKTP